jgi:hypothetical protein
MLSRCTAPWIAASRMTISSPARLLRFFGDLLDADGKRLRRGGFTSWNL